MKAQLFRLINKVVRINADAVTSYKAGSEAESIPLCIHPINYFVGIDPHSIKDHCQLIHESNVDVSLTVFNYLHCFCCPYIAYRISAGCNNDIDAFRSYCASRGITYLIDDPEFFGYDYPSGALYNKEFFAEYLTPVAYFPEEATTIYRIN